MMGGSGFIQNMIISLRENGKLKNRIKLRKSSNYKTHINLTHEEASEDDLKRIREQMVSQNKLVRKKLIVAFMIIVISVIILAFLFNYNIRIKGINGH